MKTVKEILTNIDSGRKCYYDSLLKSIIPDPENAKSVIIGQDYKGNDFRLQLGTIHEMIMRGMIPPHHLSRWDCLLFMLELTQPSETASLDLATIQYWPNLMIPVKAMYQACFPGCSIGRIFWKDTDTTVILAHIKQNFDEESFHFFCNRIENLFTTK